MEHITLVSKIVSHLLKVDRKILHQSQIEYNATDRILYNLDEMAILVHHQSNDLIIHDYISMAFFKLKDTNINAIKLSQCTNSTCTISTLKNSDVNDTALLKDMDTAVVLSKEVVKQIQEAKGTARLVLTVFFHNALFNEEDRQVSTSMIFGILLTGEKINFILKLHTI